MPWTAERRAGVILASIAAIEGIWVVLNFAVNPAGFLRFLGFAVGRAGTPSGWVAALVVALAFVAASLRLPSVRSDLLRPSWLKVLALEVAVVAGILEEVVFRKLLMDWLQRENWGGAVQIIASGLAFGAAHAVWGIFGRSLRAASGAMVATGLLGLALAVVYVIGGRSVAPCVVAHFAINALIEPGLVLAAARGEMGRAAAAIA